MSRIIIDRSLCQGCLNCTLACMAEHNEKGKSVFDLDLEDGKNESRSYIVMDSEGKVTPIFCRHCDEPECVAACMSGALSKDPVTGIVKYDEEKCADCFMCVMSCPFGVLKADNFTKKIILKCDFCEGRETPRCIENCPSGAISLSKEGLK